MALVDWDCLAALGSNTEGVGAEKGVECEEVMGPERELEGAALPMRPFMASEEEELPYMSPSMLLLPVLLGFE